MADWYIDDQAVGANDGTSWSDAYTDPNSGTYAAGDNVYVRNGPYNLLWTITDSGTAVSPIKIIGCDSSGDPIGAGSPYGSAGTVWFDGQSTRANCIEAGTEDNLAFYNIGCRNATGVGLNATLWQTQYYLFDCEFSNNGVGGVSGLSLAIIARCKFQNNSEYGCLIYKSYIVDCFFSANLVYCVFVGSTGVFVDGCVFQNSPIGVSANSAETHISNCTFFNCTDAGVRNLNTHLYVDKNLFHSCDKEYKDGNSGDQVFWDRNYKYNITNPNDISGSFHEVIPDVTLSTDPFVDAAGGDYKLVPGTEARGIETYFNANNSSFNAAGALEPEQASGGGIFTPKQRIHGV